MTVQPYNGAIRNPTEAVWGLVVTLETVVPQVGDGWLVLASGDGLSNAGVNAVTGPGSGAGGLDNPYAWLFFSESVSGEQFVMQRDGTTNERWRVVVSIGGAFNTNAGAYTPKVAPTAVDGVLAVDRSFRLFSPGPKMYVCSVSPTSTAAWALVVQDPNLPAATTVMSYDIFNDKRIITHMGDFSSTDRTRQRRAYPSRRVPEVGFRA